MAGGVRRSTIPTCESIGHVSAENSAIEHCGVAWGLPMKPGGGGRWRLWRPRSCRRSGSAGVNRVPTENLHLKIGVTASLGVDGTAE